MLCAEAAHADKMARTRGFCCDCHPVSSPFHQTCILPYIIALFTIMHPTADSGFWCTVLQNSHTNEGAASLTHLSLLVGRGCTYFKGNVATVAIEEELAGGGRQIAKVAGSSAAY